MVHTALGILHEARQGPGANEITYQTTLRVVHTLVRNQLERWTMVRDIIQLCCTDRQLTQSVLQQARHALTNTQYAMLEKEWTDPETGKIKECYFVPARSTDRSPSSSWNRKNQR
jgi:hypothetical protein